MKVFCGTVVFTFDECWMAVCTGVYWKCIPPVAYSAKSFHRPAICTSAALGCWLNGRQYYCSGLLGKNTKSVQLVSIGSGLEWRTLFIRGRSPVAPANNAKEIQRKLLQIDARERLNMPSLETWSGGDKEVMEGNKKLRQRLISKGVINCHGMADDDVPG